ncbi:hypothetical protein SCUCBS95973_007216 [Sporothrix curviconia]|uniref:Uncharacterized protein n=1 Tax=Sporothrix curviconia TaxID=1260050 RepID=A0ABP0CBK2_9PEZI
MASRSHASGIFCLLLATLSSCSAFTNLGQAADELLVIKPAAVRSHGSPYAPDATLVVVRREVDTNFTLMAIQPGSVCTAEGQWNCLTTCWQRCASGIWSDTMALSPGTACAPAGLTYDMQIVDGDGTSVISSSSSVHDGSPLSTVLSVTMGPCSCTVSSSTASTGCSMPASSSASTSPTTPDIPNESGTFGDGGGFMSGTSTAAAGGQLSGLSMTAIVGTVAIVFAHLLM